MNNLSSLPAPADTGYVYTDTQLNAVERMVDHVLDPTDIYLIVEGYAGTGKSASLLPFSNRLPQISKHAQLIDPETDELEYYFTATTNPAAEALSFQMDHEVRTIFSLLGISPTDNKGTGDKLKFNRPNNSENQIVNAIIVIDEAGTITPELWDKIHHATDNCKFILVGDPYQLIEFHAKEAYIWTLGYDKVIIDENVRSGDDTPITRFGTVFRETVRTGQWTMPVIDGYDIERVDRPAFEQALINHYGPGNAHSKKTLAWRNTTCISFINSINMYFKNSIEFGVGDTAIVNEYFKTANASVVLKSNQTVRITKTMGTTSFEGHACHRYEINDSIEVLVPDDIPAFKTESKRLEKIASNPALDHDARVDASNIVRKLETNLLDLRFSHAQTVNKSQGSTYDVVFIDADDIFRCKNYNLLARLMYVAGSRARSKIYITGGPNELFGN